MQERERKRHLIKPPPALDNPEDPRERGAGKKAEQAKEEGERDVGGADTDDEQEDQARAEPCCCPGQANPDCAADASQPLLHYYLPVHLNLLPPMLSIRSDDALVPRRVCAATSRGRCLTDMRFTCAAPTAPVCGSGPAAEPP